MAELTPMLRLDLVTVATFRRLLVSYVVMATLFAAAGGASFALPILGVLGIVVGTTLVGAVDTQRLALLYGSLPVRRRTVVTAHYVVSAGTTLLATALGMAVTAVASLVRGEPVDGLVWSGVGMIGALFAVLAVSLPVYLTWGARAGVVIMLMIAMVGTGVAAFGPSRPVIASLAALGGVLAWGLLGCGVVALAVSLPVAVAVYERQDH